MGVLANAMRVVVVSVTLVVAIVILVVAIAAMAWARRRRGADRCVCLARLQVRSGACCLELLHQVGDYAMNCCSPLRKRAQTQIFGL